MDISIKILDKTPDDYYGIPSALGQIQINDFKESFMMPIEYWSIEDYEQQWKEGLERIKTHDTSCLITAIQDPTWDPFLNWWTLYKEGNTIFIRNYLFVAEIYEKNIGDKSFTRETCYQFIPPRKKAAKNKRISEWKVSLAD